MSVGVLIIRRDAGEPEPHKCPLPGWYMRWAFGLREGAVVECQECRRRYEWLPVQLVNSRRRFDWVHA